ncbi:DUF3604 domain-containing protein [Porticoccaceae bacterium]|nr:DUF3604 domain-containing protein [Porticoccaceae bacterium]MDC1513633.1 DUF3604 domain-containing protein [Porticoccaceae bacterium]
MRSAIKPSRLTTRTALPVVSREGFIAAHNGMKVRLARPLDFLVIADHAQNMGVMPAARTGDPLLLASDKGREFYTGLQAQDDNDKKVISYVYDMENGPFTDRLTIRDPVFRQSVWQRVINNAEENNMPGIFTAFIGFEWTPLELGKWPDNAYTLHHRVVIFKDGAERTEKILPFTKFDSEDPEDLWAYLSNYEQETGGKVLAIPHNTNMSRGQAFAPNTVKGNPITKNYAEQRRQWEPLLEVTQIKGDSETHPLISPTDEFADYETWQYDLANGINEQQSRQYEYARSALKLGLAHKNKLGINPFKFGMIGSSDAHTSLAAVAENNFWGKFSDKEPGAEGGIYSAPGIEGGYNAAGYAGVWATENTREALFEAMKRKEVYASTGPRITVRFFGGWDYVKDDAYKPDLARIGYTKGVPMGGDLTAAPKDKAPSFLIRAVKDPIGANLDRVQVIKGWHDAKGELHEKIYNVALSDERKENWLGNIKPVGNTIDVADASYTNTIGDPELAVVWTDPDFDKDELTFYYLRVLEIPTPRWPAYDAKFFNLKDLPEEIPMVTQERAYSSPIWYSPGR